MCLGPRGRRFELILQIVVVHIVVRLEPCLVLLSALVILSIWLRLIPHAGPPMFALALTLLWGLVVFVRIHIDGIAHLTHIL